MWIITVQNSVKLTPELLNLFSNLKPLLDRYLCFFVNSLKLFYPQFYTYLKWYRCLETMFRYNWFICCLRCQFIISSSLLKIVTDISKLYFNWFILNSEMWRVRIKNKFSSFLLLVLLRFIFTKVCELLIDSIKINALLRFMRSIGLIFEIPKIQISVFEPFIFSYQ